MHIAVLVGSLREGSRNARVADAVAKPGPDEVTFTRSRLDDLPPYNQDGDGGPAPSGAG